MSRHYQVEMDRGEIDVTIKALKEYLARCAEQGETTRLVNLIDYLEMEST